MLTRAADSKLSLAVAPDTGGRPELDASTGLSRESERGRQLYAFAATAAVRDIPPDVTEKVEIHFLDSLCAIVSGSALEAGKAGLRYVQSVGGRGEATVLGTDVKVSMVDAALANGMSAHADESDDSHETSQTHPGCAILPAVLSVAEARRASGQAALQAMWMAYEVTIRFGETIAPAMSFARSSRSCHAHTGLFGAGFAAGGLLGFGPDRFRTLTNYLAQEASGLTTWRLDDAHTLKSYVFAGMPAANGTRAAALVESGFTGNGDVLDTRDRNIFDAISADCDLSRLNPSYETFRILETDLKKYSVGFPIAAPIAGLEALLAKHSLGPDEVTAMRVRYHPDWYAVVGDENRMADLNLRYCLAVTLLDGQLTFAASHDNLRLRDPRVRAMAERIDLLPHEEGQDRFEARLELDTAEGTLTSREGLMVRGRKDNPMTLNEVHAKARDLLSSVMSQDQADDLIAEVHRLRNAPDVHRLVALCHPGGRVARGASAGRFGSEP